LQQNAMANVKAIARATANDIRHIFFLSCFVLMSVLASVLVFLSKSDYGELLPASSSEFRVGFPPERIMFKFRVLQLPLLVLLLASITQGSAQFAHTDGKTDRRCRW
jgi:hypothetical protein